MSDEGTRAFAAAFRYLGIDAHPSPSGDERTYELAGRFTSGDECLPERVTVGDFLKVAEQPNFDPSKVAFFMPTAGGPCRFGQYAPFLRQVMREAGYEDVLVVEPSSADGYAGLGEYASPLMRLGWWGLIGGDAIRKMLHIYRPHELLPEAGQCLLDQGVICVGPVTRGGCDAACPRAAMPCTGCLGPTPKAGDPGLAMISALASLVRAGDEGEDAFDAEDRVLDGLVDPLGTLYKYSLPTYWQAPRPDGPPGASPPSRSRP